MSLKAAAYRYEMHCATCDAFWAELDKHGSCPGCLGPSTVRGITTLYELVEENA